MANVNAPFGFACRGNLMGNSPQATIECFIPASDSTAVFVGDAVKTALGTDANSGEMTVSQCTNAQVIFGIAAGFNPIKGVAIGSENLNRVYRPASTAMYVEVLADPDNIYEIQANGTVTAGMLGQYGNIAATPVGSTVTGMSAMVFDVASATNTKAGAQMLLIGTVAAPDNAVSAAYTRVLVKLVNQLQS